MEKNEFNRNSDTIKIIMFYIFTIIAPIPFLIAFMVTISIVGISLGASGGITLLVLFLVFILYLFLNYFILKSIKKRWTHFAIGLVLFFLVILIYGTLK